MSQDKSSERKSLWRPIVAMVFELWRAHPIAFIVLIATTVIPGFSYSVYVLAMRGLINALVESPTSDSWDIPTYMFLYIAAVLVEMTMNMLRPIIMVYLRDHATYHIQSRIYEQAANAPLIRFEDSAFYDCLRRADNNLGDRLTELLNGMLLPLWQFSIAASIAGTLIVVHPGIIPIMALGIIPSLLLQSKRARMVYDVLGQLDAMSDDARLLNAAHQADILDIHADLNDGWDGYLGRKFGDRDLSGGQWQKVALGRAYLKDADLVVLDEPTSALDPKSELALFERFVDLTENRTALMISHRLGAARLADRVIVMADGQIVESGSHEELLNLNGEYARLFSAQAQWYQ